MQRVFPALQQLGQLGRRALVAACQLHPGGNAAVHGRQTFGIGLTATQIAVQRVRSILQLSLGSTQDIHHVAQLVVVTFDII